MVLEGISLFRITLVAPLYVISCHAFVLFYCRFKDFQVGYLLSDGDKFIFSYYCCSYTMCMTLYRIYENKSLKSKT